MITRRSKRNKTAGQKSKASNKISTEEDEGNQKENKSTQNNITPRRKSVLPHQNPASWNGLHTPTSFKKRRQTNISKKKKKKARSSDRPKKVTFESGLAEPSNDSMTFVSFPTDIDSANEAIFNGLDTALVEMGVRESKPLTLKKKASPDHPYNSFLNYYDKSKLMSAGLGRNSNESWATGNILDFMTSCLMYGEDKKNSKILCMPSHFFERIDTYTREKGEMPQSTGIFSADVIVIDVTQPGGGHFSKAIIVKPRLVLKDSRYKATKPEPPFKDDDPIPIIFHCDSHPGCAGHPDAVKVGLKIRKWLNYECGTQSFNTTSLGCFPMQIPVQPDCWSCGFQGMLVLASIKESVDRSEFRVSVADRKNKFENIKRKTFGYSEEHGSQLAKVFWDLASDLRKYQKGTAESPIDLSKYGKPAPSPSTRGRGDTNAVCKQKQEDAQSSVDSSKPLQNDLSEVKKRIMFPGVLLPKGEVGKGKKKKISRRRKVGSRPKTVNQTKDYFVRTQLGPLCNAFMAFANMTTFENESLAEIYKGVPMAIVALDHVVEKPREQISDVHKVRQVPKLKIFSNTKSNAKLMNDALFRKEIEREYFGDVSAFRSALFGAPYNNKQMKKEVVDMVKDEDMMRDEGKFPLFTPDANTKRNS